MYTCKFDHARGMVSVDIYRFLFKRLLNRVSSVCDWQISNEILRKFRRRLTSSNLLTSSLISANDKH